MWRSNARESIALPLSAAGQQPAVRPGVSVLLIDPSSAAIPNAAVRIFETDDTTGVPVKDVRTDSNGRVTIQLPAGSYLLQSEAPGFTTVQQSIVMTEAATPLIMVLKHSIADTS